MAGNVTLKAIAKKAGLSVPTVCLALSGHPRVSQKTQERVRRISAALGYRSNGRAAAGGDKGVRRTYGLIILGLGHSQKAGSGIVQALCHVAATMDRRVEVIVIQDTTDQAAVRSRLAACARELDGLFLTELVEWDILDYAATLNKPALVLGDVIEAPGRHVESIGLGQVTYDVIGMGRLATRHLLQRGLAPVAFLSYAGHRGLYQDRWLTGYCTALVEANLKVDDALLYLTTPTDFVARDVAKHFLSLPVVPKGYVLPDPELAMQLLHALEQLKHPVPPEAVVLGGTRERVIQCGLDACPSVEPDIEVWAKSVFIHMELLVNGTISWPETVTCRFRLHKLPATTPPAPAPPAAI